MHKFNYLCSLILIITLPLTITILSSNLILRVSETYNYHFNDSQAISEIPYYVTGSEVSGEIASYFSSFRSDAFQVYEKNGNYRDPVFEEDEQLVMKKAKNILNIELAGGLICLLISIAIYIYLWKNGYREALRNRYRVSAVLSVILMIGRIICVSAKPFRLWLYDRLIGVQLAENSTTLSTLLGDPFFKTYLVFATILGGVILAVATYADYNLTKPPRIFY